MERPEWFVTWSNSWSENDATAKAHALGEAVWTIGPDARYANWETDSGYPGYGMKKEDADFACLCYNLLRNIPDPTSFVAKALAAGIT